MGSARQHGARAGARKGHIRSESAAYFLKFLTLIFPDPSASKSCEVGGEGRAYVQAYRALGGWGGTTEQMSQSMEARAATSKCPCSHTSFHSNQPEMLSPFLPWDLLQPHGSSLSRVQRGRNGVTVRHSPYARQLTEAGRGKVRRRQINEGILRKRKSLNVTNPSSASTEDMSDNTSCFLHSKPSARMATFSSW